MEKEGKLESWSDFVRAANRPEDLGLPKVECSPREAIVGVCKEQYEQNQRGLAELRYKTFIR